MGVAIAVPLIGDDFVQTQTHQSASPRFGPAWIHGPQHHHTMSSKTLLVPLPILLRSCISAIFTETQQGSSLMMSSVAARIVKHLRVTAPTRPTSSFVVDVQRNLNSCYSTASFDGENEKVGRNNEGEEELDDEFFTTKPELQPQGVDPRRGWGFRGVHKAIICGKIGQAPVQKILRNGQTVTIFTVGTGGMFDQRIVGSKDLPKPAQWHRVAVHNELLGAYAVQQLVKNSSVYVEGDIETRVYNDSINGEVKNVPEICVRRDGKIHLMKSGESISNISFEELREGLL